MDTNHWPLQTTAQLVAFYGDPDTNDDGTPDVKWQVKELVRITPPFPMFLAWRPTAKVSAITIHQKCAPSLARILDDIWDAVGNSPDEIRRIGVDQFGGSFNFRLMRGGNSLSMHSYGCALDLDPVRNGMGKRWRAGANMMDMRVVRAFQREGWVWGGDFINNPDAMHFQAARIK